MNTDDTAELDPDDLPQEDGDGRLSYNANQEASYACWACGEEIVIPIDIAMGSRQEYVEDCPVCCRPNQIHIELDPEHGDVRCWNEVAE